MMGMSELGVWAVAISTLSLAISSWSMIRQRQIAKWNEEMNNPYRSQS